MDKQIILRKESKSLLEYVKNEYKEIEKYVPVKELLIHMYPESDTWMEDGEWWSGYMDSLFMTIKVYDPENKTVFIMKGRDMIDLTGFEGHSSTIKMFKDKSTMITLKSRKEIKLRNLQCVEFY